MKSDYQVYLLFCVFILYSCSGTEIEDYKVFTAKKSQSVAERTVSNLRVVDSLNITKTFNGLSLSEMRHNKASIFAKLGDQIVKIDKQDLSTELRFMLPEGKGPGEVVNFNRARLGAGEDMIAVYDGSARKTMLFDLNGNFQDEFLNSGYQVRDMAMMDEQTYYYEVMPGSEYLFYKVERTNSTSVVRREFQEQSNGMNILAYGGSIAVHNQSLYFGGSSEPLIRRYDLSGEEVKLVFSRAVIDAYDSENNYRKPEGSSGGGGIRRYAHTDNAQYASKDIAVDNNFLYSVRYHNGKKGYNYLDIYAVENGRYLKSFATHNYPQEIVVDEHYTYTIELKGAESLNTYLMKYEKPVIDF